MPHEHEFEIALAAGVKVFVGQSGRPVERYAVVLLVWADDAWVEARVFDNHLGTHHMHRYTRSGGKQQPAPFQPGPTRAAMPAAIHHIKAHWEAIVEAWKSS